MREYFNLTIYLTHDKIYKRKQNNNERKKVVRWISELDVYQEMRNDVEEIY